MEVRYPIHTNQHLSMSIGTGEVYSYADMDGKHLALVQMPDRSIVTASVPRGMECPEIGKVVEVVRNPIQAAENFLIAANM